MPPYYPFILFEIGDLISANLHAPLFLSTLLHYNRL